LKAAINIRTNLSILFHLGIAMKQNTSIGDRVRISALGASRFPRLANKTGTVVGGSIYMSSISVRLDGNKSSSAFHRDYVDVMIAADPVE
jgi:hypothetical protein